MPETVEGPSASSRMGSSETLKLFDSSCSVISSSTSTSRYTAQGPSCPTVIVLHVGPRQTAE
jgi:hypothetical protein